MKKLTSHKKTYRETSVTISGIFGGCVLLFVFFLSIVPVSVNAVECSVKRAEFLTLGTDSAGAPQIVHGGFKSDGWYSSDFKPNVYIEIETESCNGKKMQVRLVERDGWGALNENRVDELNNVEARPTNEYIGYKMYAGNDECDNSGSPDCDLKIEVDVEKCFGLCAFIEIYDSSDFPPGGWLGYNTDFGEGEKFWVKQAGPITEDPEDNDIASFLAGTTVDATIDPYSITGSQTLDACGTNKTCYALIEPIAGFETFDGTKTIGDYVNMTVRITIAIATVLAVIMIIVGGLQYMSTDAITGKREGINKLTGAILGLLVVLSIFVILNSINPYLLNINPGIPSLELTADEANFSLTETPADQQEDFALNGTYTSPTPSVQALLPFNDKLKNQGYEITEINVKTATKKAEFVAKKGSLTERVEVNVNLGASGVAETGQGASGDKKTPKGTSSVVIDRNLYVATSQAQAILTRDGKLNMGAAFVNLGIMLNGQNRQIGLHGHANNTLASTNGCVRMCNDDLLLIAPFIKEGTQVNII